MANKLSELSERIDAFNADLFKASGKMAALASERLEIIGDLSALGIRTGDAKAMLGAVSFSVVMPAGWEQPPAEAPLSTLNGDDGGRLVGGDRERGD